jgi:hypothetical protein
MSVGSGSQVIVLRYFSHCYPAPRGEPSPFPLLFALFVYDSASIGMRGVYRQGNLLHLEMYDV